MKVSMNMNIRHFAHGALLIAVALLLTLPLALQAAKATPVTVTAADPKEAIQGDMRTIKITGTGFDSGSKASFLVSGTTDASQIVVTTVRFKSSTELEADIQVQPSALTVNYDIAVVTSTGRKGKGTTLFKVNLDPSVILPVSLGVPTGCSRSMATGLNDGAYPAALIVVADTNSCTTGTDRPYRWQNGSWYNLGTLGSATSGVAEGVSNDGTVVGSLGSSSTQVAFVASGGSMSPLPVLAGMTYSYAYGISQDASHIFGYSSIEGETDAVRWSRNAGGAWSVEVIGAYGPGLYRYARASSDDGSVIVGFGPYPGSTTVYEGWVWVEGGSPDWVSLGAGTEAFDIDPTATMIVGYREAVGCPPSCIIRTAVYWSLDGTGNWVSHDLTPLDSAFSSYAFGVGMVNGKLVIVGRSNVRKDASSIARAVAWLPQPGGGYGPPIQLAGFEARATLAASARDVNANGVVAGWYEIPKGNLQAVLWMLPALP
ncbi:MAG: hypothetical protein EHM68_11280 [Lysobacterales bacterium]|nr:MAG: hypothetical protein EHM68_11280 [Xanthomonadales bacterium]